MIELPIEIINKIMLYNIHPVTELLKNIHPITRIIKPIIKKHVEINKNYAIFFPEDEHEFVNFSEYYMYFSNENPRVIHNNQN